MIKYESIISSFDDKDTLYNWLRKVEEQLKNASATGFVVNKKGNATLSFSITFANGETLESGDIVLQQGESVDDARIASGILQLHLTNGTWLTAGNVKAVSNFEINAYQHLIVNYQDGTSQDLGAIFQGNINVQGDLDVDGDITTETGTIDGHLVTGDEIVEKMSGYSFVKSTSDSDITFNNYVYAGVVKNGNKVTYALGLNITRLQDLTNYGENKKVGIFVNPVATANKLYPAYNDVWFGAVMATISCLAVDTSSNSKNIKIIVAKNATNLELYALSLNELDLNKQYYLRFEITFLLSDNLAQ